MARAGKSTPCARGILWLEYFYTWKTNDFYFELSRIPCFFGSNPLKPSLRAATRREKFFYKKNFDRSRPVDSFGEKLCCPARRVSRGWITRIPRKAGRPAAALNAVFTNNSPRTRVARRTRTRVPGESVSVSLQPPRRKHRLRFLSFFRAQRVFQNFFDRLFFFFGFEFCLCFSFFFFFSAMNGCRTTAVPPRIGTVDEESSSSAAAAAATAATTKEGDTLQGSATATATLYYVNEDDPILDATKVVLEQKVFIFLVNSRQFGLPRDNFVFFLRQLLFSSPLARKSSFFAPLFSGTSVFRDPAASPPPPPPPPGGDDDGRGRRPTPDAASDRVSYASLSRARVVLVIAILLTRALRPRFFLQDLDWVQSIESLRWPP